MSTIGDEIKRLRTEAGLSQSQLAEKIDMAQSDVSKWERNAGTTSDATLAAIAQATGQAADVFEGHEWAPTKAQRKTTPENSKVYAENAAKAREKGAEKRELKKAIEPYLEMLERGTTKKPAGRRTIEYMNQRIELLNEELNATPPPKPLVRVTLLQEKLDLVNALAMREAEQETPIAELEAAFIKALPRYSELSGITRQAWRLIGVPVKVLNAAYKSQAPEED